MVSLIIPTLNEAETLPRTLSRLTPETRERYGVELIVSDGGSADRTAETARGLGAQVVEAAERQTIAAGRNAGASAAQGDVLVFLDADSCPRSWDELFTESLGALKDEKVVAATVRVEVDPKERTFADAAWLAFFNLLFLCQNLLGFGMGRGNCQVVRASAFRRAGGYDASLTASEDYDLYRRLRKVGRISFLWRVVVYESPRRFRKLGYMKVTRLWFTNWVGVALRHRAVSKSWQRVR